MTSGYPVICWPIGVAVVFGLFGFAASWEKLLGIMIAAYASIVIASQHNVFLTGVVANMGWLPATTYLQQSAFAFGATLAVLFCIILIFYRIVWRPGQRNQSDTVAIVENGWTKLLRATLSSVTGWMLSVLTLVSAVAYQLPQHDTGSQLRQLKSTVQIATGLASPWLVGNPPIVLQDRLSSNLEPPANQSPQPTEQNEVDDYPDPTVTQLPRSTDQNVLVDDPIAVVILPSSALRVGPGADYEYIRWVYEEEELFVISRYGEGRLLWYRVRTENGEEGWVWHGSIDLSSDETITVPRDEEFIP